MKYAVTGLMIGLICSLSGQAQDYHAIEGSPYAGGIGAANNPASIVNASFPWDITVFSLEEKNTTNAVKFTDFSYISKDTIHYKFAAGYMKRYAAFNFNVHLLNVRLALGRKQAIAFGANLRGYGSVRTGPVNYNDTLKNMNEFFNINEGTTYNANMVSSTWVEGFATYSRTLVDDAYGRLNGGITLKGMRGISGAYAQLESGSVNRTIPPGNALTIYDLAAGSGRYAYSSNYDYWKNGKSGIQNLEDFLGHTRPGAAVDLGFEYLVKPQTVNVYDEGDSYYDYNWKIGVSLLDVGENVYKYGSQSRVFGDPKTNVADSELNEKFDRLKTLAGFNDSMATVVNAFHNLQGLFKVWNPTRLVLNIDRPLSGHFAVNTNLILNLGGSNTGQRLFTKEITLLSITPRWETKKLGGYLPLEVTTDGRIWVGGAFKAGPLLLGIDNWLNLISRSKMANGGIYLALVIKPGKGFSFKEDKKYTCPKN
ncbi:MAG TPA: hypothetical protein VG052_03390 [Puia sp.]|jgi:hypothetical protein|nr:hypothetical protein [Puia sp.]